MDKDILIYQNVDAQLFKIEKLITDSEHFRNFEKAKKEYSKAVDQIKRIDEVDSKPVIDEIAKLSEIKNKGVDKAATLVKENIKGLDEKKLAELDNNINKTIHKLGILEEHIKMQHEKAKEINSKFESLRNMAKEAKQLAEAEYQKYKEILKKIEPEQKVLKAKLDELSKNVDQALFKKYLKLRAQGVFPVVVNLLDDVNACGGCGVEINSLKMQKINSDGYSDCEQCRRIIFKN